jgi:hypothetical protein
MTKNRSQPKVVVDTKHNRLYIQFGDRLTKKDIEVIYTDIRFGVADLKPGFSVINDLSKCSIGHLSGAATFKKITNFLTEKEVGRVIRIIGQTSVLFKQITNISDLIAGYKPEYVSTIEEAEALLGSSNQ